MRWTGITNCDDYYKSRKYCSLGFRFSNVWWFIHEVSILLSVKIVSFLQISPLVYSPEMLIVNKGPHSESGVRMFKAVLFSFLHSGLIVAISFQFQCGGSRSWTLKNTHTIIFPMDDNHNFLAMGLHYIKDFMCRNRIINFDNRSLAVTSNSE